MTTLTFVITSVSDLIELESKLRQHGEDFLSCRLAAQNADAQIQCECSIFFVYYWGQPDENDRVTSITKTTAKARELFIENNPRSILVTVYTGIR